MRLLLILLLTLNLLQAKKIALLIGNSDYDFAPLSNPLNDVDGIKKTLNEIGFRDIKVLKNASQTQMQTALANFSQRASSAEIALVYFSGHGMQVNNTNYMLPAKTHPQKPVDLYGLVNLDYFIQSASSAKYGIILVDACRNNPLVKYFQNGKHKGAGAKKGLGQVTPKSGQVVIGFATSAGDTADDGNGNMSPYAKALSKRLKEPNKDITKVLGLVALDVSARYTQYPIYRANLAYNVCLIGQCNNQLIVPNLTSKTKTDILIKKGITTINHIMWQDEPINRIKRLTWKDAINYCKNLTLGGYDDWELPSKDILLEVARSNEMYAYMSSPNSQLHHYINAKYWSSSINSDDIASYVIFDNFTPSDSLMLMDKVLHVRCIRAEK